MKLALLAASAVLLVASCTTEDEEPEPPEPLTAAQLQQALITKDDLPSGWVTDTEPESPFEDARGDEG